MRTLFLLHCLCMIELGFGLGGWVSRCVFVSHNLSSILSNIFVIFLLVENENSDSSNRSIKHKYTLCRFCISLSLLVSLVQTILSSCESNLTHLYLFIYYSSPYLLRLPEVTAIPFTPTSCSQRYFCLSYCHFPLTPSIVISFPSLTSFRCLVSSMVTEGETSHLTSISF